MTLNELINALEDEYAALQEARKRWAQAAHGEMADLARETALEHARRCAQLGAALAQFRDKDGQPPR